MAQVEGSEIRLTRVYEAPLGAVWRAWTDPNEVAKWWGPRGFTLTTHSKDLRSGGTWRYTMHGPDGVDYPNVTRYLDVSPGQRLVYDHGGTDDRPPLFRVTVTFREEDGHTTMEMASALSSPEAAREMAGFIKKAGGEATWDRLAEHLAEVQTGEARFVIHRVFEAPLDRVQEMWTSPDRLALWLLPAGLSLRWIRKEIAEGASTFFAMESGDVAMFVRADYEEIGPAAIVYTQRFVDADEAKAPAPGAPVWPEVLRVTVRLFAESPGRTRVAVITSPEGAVTAAEREAFLAERPGMTLGWTGSFDALEALL